jgi:hypothetical protein
MMQRDVAHLVHTPRTMQHGGLMPSLGWRRMVVVALALVVQPPPTTTLSRPDVEFREPFSQVEGIRELSDGRVIVVDSRERLIHAVDLKAGTATRIGREGGGPGEYRIPLRIFALPGDSSVIHDMANAGNPLVITPQGEAGGSLALRDGSPLLDRSATDARGRIYSEVRIVTRSPSGVPMRNDSLGIERLDRSNGKRDTLARVSGLVVSPLVSRPARRSGVPEPGGGAPARSGAMPPFASRDQWAVSSEGRVAVVSVDPYRVVFVDARGVRTVGPVLDAGRVRVNDALKDLWRAGARRPVPSLVFSGGQTVATSRPPRYEEPTAWPEFLPALLDRAVAFAPDGTLWVSRAVAADSPPVLDRIDGAGKVIGRVVLPSGTKLIGFGAKSVYLVRIDADDLQYLQRYSLPVTTGAR